MRFPRIRALQGRCGVPLTGQVVTACTRTRIIPCPSNAPVAQLDRVPPSEGGGHRFESCRARHTQNSHPCGDFFVYGVWDSRFEPVRSAKRASVLGVAAKRRRGDAPNIVPRRCEPILSYPPPPRSLSQWLYYVLCARWPMRACSFDKTRQRFGRRSEAKTGQRPEHRPQVM